VDSTIRVAGLVVLASIGLPWRAAAQGPDPAPASPAANATPSSPSSATSPAASKPSTATRPAPRKARRYPIRDSIDRAIDAVLLAHEKPCEWSRMMGVPCFPVDVEQEGPRFSVAEALRLYRGTGSPAPGVPTVADMQRQLSGAPLSASGSVGFDPGCTTKNLLKKISGKNTTFHLYRMWDARGERPMLTDRVLDPKTYAANLDVHYEYLGQFDGECAAVAAWRRALRKATEKEPMPDDWDEVKEPPPP